jgi:hypothetical protein
MKQLSRSLLAGALLLGLLHAARGMDPPGTQLQTPPCCLVAAPPPDERGTAQQPLVVNGTLRKTDAEKFNEVAEQGWRHTVDRWTIGASIATILVLIGQGIAFVFQAHRLKESVHEMKRATEATPAMAVAEQATVDMSKGLLGPDLRQLFRRSWLLLNVRHCLQLLELGS